MGGRTAAERLTRAHDQSTQRRKKTRAEPQQQLVQQTAGVSTARRVQQSVESRPQANYRRTVPPQDLEGTRNMSASTTSSRMAAASTSYTVTPRASVPQRPCPSAAATARETVLETQSIFSPVTSTRNIIIPTIVVLPDIDSVSLPAGAVVSSPTTGTNVANLEVPPPMTPRAKLQTASQESCKDDTSRVVIDEFEGEIAAESAAQGCCVGAVARDVIHFFFSGGGAVAACASDTLETGTPKRQASDYVDPVAAADRCRHAVHGCSSSISNIDDINTHDTDLKEELSVCGSYLNNWCAPSLVYKSRETNVQDSTQGSSRSSSEGTAHGPPALGGSPDRGDAAVQGGEVLHCSTSAASRAKRSALLGYVNGCAKQLCVTLSRCYPADMFSPRVFSDSVMQDSGKESERHSKKDSSCSISTDGGSTSTVPATQASSVAEIATDPPPPVEAPVTADAGRSREEGDFSASVQSYIWSNVSIFFSCTEPVAARRSSRTSEDLGVLQKADGGGAAGELKSKSCALAASEKEIFKKDNESASDIDSCNRVTGKALLFSTVAAGDWVKNTRKHMLPAVKAISQLGGCYTDFHHISNDSDACALARKRCYVCSGLDFADVPLLS